MPKNAWHLINPALGGWGEKGGKQRGKGRNKALLFSQGAGGSVVIQKANHWPDTVICNSYIQ